MACESFLVWVNTLYYHPFYGTMMMRPPGRQPVVSRRHMLCRMLPGGAAAALWGSAAWADQTPLKQRQPEGLKLSCSSLAFSETPWEQALAEIKKLGFRYADLAMFEGWAHVSPSALTNPEGHARKIAEVSSALGIEPIAIHADFAIGEPKTFPGLTIQEPAARKTILAHFERVVACGRAAAIPLVNVQPGKFIADFSREASLKNAIDMLTRMHEIASRRSLTLSIENHTGSVAQQPEDAEAILKAVPGLKLDYDLSHLVANSISLEQTIPLLKYVAHVGVCNAKVGSHNEPIREGRLFYPIGPFLRALRNNQVNAFVSVECSRPNMRASIPLLKAILEEQGITPS